MCVQKEEGGLLGALQHVAAKDEDMELAEMDMELSGGSGSGHLDGLLGFDDDRADQKPQQHCTDIVPSDAGNKQVAVVGKKKRYHRHTAHQIQQMEA